MLIMPEGRRSLMEWGHACNASLRASRSRRRFARTRKQSLALVTLIGCTLALASLGLLVTWIVR
jgi:hypothetical protein